MATRVSDKEAPPKDNNERVERLLTKLENASRLTDMEEMSRELRYLDEFDLHTAAYNEDQIKRTFLVSLYHVQVSLVANRCFCESKKLQ